jgi:hypothetical protein
MAYGDGRGDGFDCLFDHEDDGGPPMINMDEAAALRQSLMREARASIGLASEMAWTCLALENQGFFLGLDYVDGIADFEDRHWGGYEG